MTVIQRVTITATIIGLVLAGCSRKTEPAPTNADSDGNGASAATESKTRQVWLKDFEAAKALAAEQDKDLILNFSGSDWCYWCKRLDAEVFSKAGFIEEAAKDFVLVVIDFPLNKSSQSRALQEQNRRLAGRYGIQGYPTIILAEPDGTPYARTGYQEGGPDAYLENLKTLRRQ